MLELERRQLDDVVLTREDAPEPRLEVTPSHRAEEADAAEVDADDRDARREEARERSQNRAVAAENDREIGGRRVRARRRLRAWSPRRPSTGARRRAPGRRPAAARALTRSDRACRASPRLPGSRAYPTASATKRSMSSGFGSPGRCSRWTKNSRFPFGPGRPESTTPTVTASQACADSMTVSRTFRCTSGRADDALRGLASAPPRTAA